MKAYVCKVCGYVHFGEEAPERCPQCGVGSDKFELREESAKKEYVDEYENFDIEKRLTIVKEHRAELEDYLCFLWKIYASCADRAGRWTWPRIFMPEILRIKNGWRSFAGN